MALFLLFLSTTPLYAKQEGDLLFQIEVPMKPGADVSVRLFDGTVRKAGRVAALPVKTRWPSYSASAWSEPGEVCASAVNAIHMLVSVEDGKGRTMSIIPKNTIAPAAGPGAAILLTSRPSYGLFGAWAPTVGSKVYVRSKDSEELLLSKERLPQKGDMLIIKVLKSEMPYMVELENRPGGRVIAWNKDRFSTIGRVIKPVAGVGRFGGTLFQKTGGLRANHSGVVDFSTSPSGQIGGFQIIPWDHALSSKEMQGAWDMTQWLIVGPADGKSLLGGVPPLFGNALVPGPSKGDNLWDFWSTHGRKSLIVVRLNGGEWQIVPIRAGKDNEALKEITHIRIYYPITDEPQKERF